MSFGIYAIGYLILIAGVCFLAHLMHVPQTYIIAIAVILFGILPNSIYQWALEAAQPLVR